MKEKEIKVTPQYFDYVFGAEYDAIVQPGGRFSGKSYNSEIEEAVNLGTKEDYKLLIIQDLDKGASDGYYAGLVEKIEQFEQQSLYNISPSSTKITHKYNGNQVLFRGYKTPQQKKDVKNIDQVTKIIVEEGEWMTFNDFLALIQQLRGKVKKDRRLDILLNTVNENCFVNAELIETKPDKVLKYFEGTKRPKIFEKSFVTEYELNGKVEKSTIKILVVLSTHFDNPYLTPQQRAAIEVLKTTDPDLYKQLGEARFVKPEGTFFKEFDKDVHVIEPFEIPSHWDRYVALDYGLDMLAVGWVAVDTQGNHYEYRVMDIPDLIISDAAKAIKEASGNEKIRYYYAPKDLWNRRQETKKTVASIFAEHGIRLDRCSVDRIAGALAIKELLKVTDSVDVETGDPIKVSKYYIFNTNESTIKSLTNLMTDDKSSDKYATEPHDITHAADRMRYYAVSRQNPTRVNKPVRRSNNTKAVLTGYNGYNRR